MLLINIAQYLEVYMYCNYTVTRTPNFSFNKIVNTLKYVHRIVDLHAFMPLRFSLILNIRDLRNFMKHCQVYYS